jgi:predicted acetyltransferase
LLSAVIDVRRLGFRITDGPYVRVLDVAAALSARSYSGDGAVVLEVGDELIPENTGTYRVDGATGEVARVATAPDIRLDIAALGAVYLGGMSFVQLADAGRLQALTAGAATRADDLFRGPRAPWSPEIF